MTDLLTRRITLVRRSVLATVVIVVASLVFASLERPNGPAAAPEAATPAAAPHAATIAAKPHLCSVTPASTGITAR